MIFIDVPGFIDSGLQSGMVHAPFFDWGAMKSKHDPTIQQRDTIDS